MKIKSADKMGLQWKEWHNKYMFDGKNFQCPELQSVRTGFLRCSKEGLYIALYTMASKEWKIYILNIKTIFLQSGIFKSNVYSVVSSVARVQNRSL